MTRWLIPIAAGVALSLSGPAIAGDATANIETPNADGLTPLMAASKAGSIGAVMELLAYRADVEAIDRRHGMNALTYAISEKREPVVRALLAAGARVEPDASVHPPLSVAAMGGAGVFVRMLLDAGARVDDRNWPFLTPLFQASCEASDDETLQLLINAGSDVNAVMYSGMTPLLCAVAYSRKNAVKLLLAHNADPNAMSKYGECAWSLALAEQAGHKERSLGILDLLGEAGATPCSPDSELGPDQSAKKANSELCVPDAGSLGSDDAAAVAEPDQDFPISKVVGRKVVKGLYGNDPTAVWPKPIDPLNIGIPETLRKKGLGAKVTVVGIVDKEGNISTFRLMTCEVTRDCIPVDEELQKQYCPEVFAATVADIEKWRFQPASLHGEPVKAHWSLRVDIHSETEPSPPECRARRERSKCVTSGEREAL